jgi:hypothetical protein
VIAANRLYLIEVPADRPISTGNWEVPPLPEPNLLKTLAPAVPERLLHQSAL